MNTGTPADMPASRVFVLLRYILIAATVYLIVVEGKFALPAPRILALLSAALASNLLASFLPASLMNTPGFKGAVILGDTIWITLALAWSGQFGSDFVYLYFFVLLLAAIGENLSLVAIGAVVVCAGYGYMMSASGENWSLWRSPSIIRLPFLFTAAAFYGYLADRMRHEQEHSLTAEAGATAKLELLATVSHEIRTPMTAILGYTDLLSRPDTREEARREYLSTLRRNGEHLMRVLDDVLDFSKIEAGKVAIETTDVDPLQVVAEVESTMRVRATEKGIDLTIECQGPLPGRIQTDATRLRQILMNLVGNAIKFTDSGGVRLAVRMAHHQEAHRPSLCFDVIDTGIGISPEAQAALFRPFIQAHPSTARRFGGTGLGLAISKRLAHLLDGDITVRSVPGEGSVFTLTMAVGAVELGVVPAPAARPHRERAGAPGAAPMRLAGTILLAEDTPDNERLISHFLTKAGARVEVAENGRIACEMASAAAAAGKPFGLILMDMQMPELDGYDATAYLRRTGHRGPIVALTAYAMSSDRAKCLSAGCNDFLTKPIDPDRLIATAWKYLHGDVSRSEGSEGSEGIGPPAGPIPISELHGGPEIKALQARFVEALPERAVAIERSFADGDVTGLARLAHQLKGTAGSYGFPGLTRAAERLEATVRAGRDSDDIRNHVLRVVDMCRRAHADRHQAPARA